MADDPHGGPGLDELVGRIEEIARQLDSDSLGLDDALALFEEGVGHLGRARKILARAELRIAELIGPAGEAIREIGAADAGGASGAGAEPDAGERPARPTGADAGATGAGDA